MHHSRLRGWLEIGRWLLTRRAPFRCHDCHWRGWRKDGGPRDRHAGVGHEVRPDLTEAQLDEIDPDEEIRT